MASSTRAFVSVEMRSLPARQRLTVAVDTPAKSATSVIRGAIRGGEIFDMRYSYHAAALSGQLKTFDNIV
jgi:hypothetical protein